MLELAPVLAGCLVLLATCAVFTHVGRWKSSLGHDTTSYAQYGHRILGGGVPYRDIAIEYPPAALPVFILPAADEKGGAAFRWRFAWLMALCGCGMLAVLAATLRTLGVGLRPRFWLVTGASAAPLLLGSIAFKRYDLWPALLTGVSLLLYLRGRSRLGGAALGLATAAKLYPIALAPLLIVDVWRRRGRAEALRSLGAGLTVFAVCFVPFLVLAPHGALLTFARELHRPLELESLGAAVVIALHHLGLVDVSLVQSYGSVNLVGHGAGAVADATVAVELAALLGIWIACARRRLAPVELATAVAAVTVVLVAFGKVFSPQYLLWVIPFFGLVVPGARRVAAALFLGACVLTQAYLQHRFGLLERLGTPETTDVLIRDVLLVALAAVLLGHARRPCSTAPCEQKPLRQQDSSPRAAAQPR